MNQEAGELDPAEEIMRMAQDALKLSLQVSGGQALVLLAAVLGFLALALRGAGGDGGHPPGAWLHTEGNKVKDGTGRTVVLRGVNLESREWPPSLGYDPSFELSAIPVLCQPPPTGWGATVLTVVFASTPVNNNDAAYLAAMDQVTNAATSYGCYVHWVYRYAMPDDSQPSGLIWVPAAKAALVRVAQRYQNNPRVIYGIKVEPCSILSDGALPCDANPPFPDNLNSAPWLPLRDACEEIIDAIRAVHPISLITVPGTHHGRYNHFAITNPVRRPNVVYKQHWYPSGVPVGQRWLNIQQEHQPQACIAAGMPLLIGEFSGAPPPASFSLNESNELLEALDWCEQNDVGWIPWLCSRDPNNHALMANLQPTSPYGVEIRNRLQAHYTASAALHLGLTLGRH